MKSRKLLVNQICINLSDEQFNRLTKTVEVESLRAGKKVQRNDFLRFIIASWLEANGVN